MSPSDISIIIDEARIASPEWSQLGVRARASYLLRARDHILANIDRFAETISQDSGKPLSEAVTSDIFPVADLLYHFATHAEKYLSDQKIGIGFMSLMLRRSRLTFPAYGVIGIISPWNYPFSIPMGNIAMALVAGNTVVCKSSELTPNVGKLIHETWQAAKLPGGVFSHLEGGADIGQALVDQRIDKLFFTGSVTVGRHLGKICGERLIPCVLELGGKDAMIVLDDADLDQASSAAVWGAFTNCGQACASVERVYVHSSVAEKFTALVVEKTRNLGRVGALINVAQSQKVASHVADARARGAKILIGGDLPDQPTVITNIDNSFMCMREETFGPLLPIMAVTSDEQAIILANDSDYGLTASVWSRNMKRANRIACQLHVGTVTINECVYTHALPQTPWGGNFASGLGRSHGKAGLMECVRIRHIHENVLPMKSLWWYPYNARVVWAFKWLTQTLTGPAWKWIAALPAIVYLMARKKR